MVGLLNSIVENRSLQDLAKNWSVTPEQAARRLRDVPFVLLDHSNPGTGTRGRPGRRLALDPDWSFWEHAGKKPLGELLTLLRTLHALGEPFALGVPLTSTFWQPFLHPEVRLLAPPETFSLWRRLFAGTSGPLRVVVDLLPGSAAPMEVEGVPVLDPPFAAVDAVLAYQAMKNLSVLALADRLAHGHAVPEPAMAYAASRGVDQDVRYLEDHRRTEGRVARSEEVREAHRLVREAARTPAGTAFHEFLEMEALGVD